MCLGHFMLRRVPSPAAKSCRSRERVQECGAAPPAAIGKVTHDGRGTAVWDWAVDTGVLNKTSTAELLDTLADPGGLTLAGETSESNDWGGDPYNRTTK
jgi:hypothetical protein